MVIQMYEVLLVHSLTKKLRVAAVDSGSLTCTKTDLEKVQHPILTPLVIQLKMNNYDVKRVLVYTRSSVEVIYYDLFKQLKLTKSDLRSARAPWYASTLSLIGP